MKVKDTLKVAYCSKLFKTFESQQSLHAIYDIHFLKIVPQKSKLNIIMIIVLSA